MSSAFCYVLGAYIGEKKNMSFDFSEKWEVLLEELKEKDPNIERFIDIDDKNIEDRMEINTTFMKKYSHQWLSGSWKFYFHSRRDGANERMIRKSLLFFKSSPYDEHLDVISIGDSTT